MQKWQGANLLYRGVGHENVVALFGLFLDAPDSRCCVKELLIVYFLIAAAVKHDFDVANAQHTTLGIVLVTVQNVGELDVRWHIGHSVVLLSQSHLLDHGQGWLPSRYLLLF